MDRGIDWTLWRSLLAVVEAGTLSGAARALGLTQPTLGRHVDTLEAQLGKRLFLRSASGLTPTPLALHLAEDARRMQHAAAAMTRRAKTAGEETGVVRIAASEIVGSYVLPPLLPAFHSAAPGIRLELDLAQTQADLVHHAADLAIRMTRPQQASLIARHLGQVALGLYAHPDYLARAGHPRAPHELRGHLLVGPQAPRDAAQLTAALGDVIGAEDFTLQTDTPAAQLQAVLSGAGIGVVQQGIARRHGLVRLLPDLPTPEMEVWLVLHPDTRLLPPVRRVADYLAEALPRAFAGQD